MVALPLEFVLCREKRLAIEGGLLESLILLTLLFLLVGDMAVALFRFGVVIIM